MSRHIGQARMAPFFDNNRYCAHVFTVCMCDKGTRGWKGWQKGILGVGGPGGNPGLRQGMEWNWPGRPRLNPNPQHRHDQSYTGSSDLCMPYTGHMDLCVSPTALAPTRWR